MRWHESRAARRIVVMAAPPTPNGDLHVGHLSGPFLSGDILSRYLRLRGAEVHFFCGTDDNQSDVRIGAEKQGLAPQQAADLAAAGIEATLTAAQIEIEHFVRPNISPRYISIVQELLSTLYKKGKLVARKAPTSYCETCQQHLYEGYILGGCPHCGNQATGGGCDECGLPNECLNLLDPVCLRCGTPASAKLLKRLHFPLNQYRDELRKYWNRVAMSPGLRSFCEQALDVGLSDVAVTSYDTWGVEVGIEGFEGQVIFTWFEEAGRYLAYALHLDGNWECLWKSEDTSTIQCFGFDNSFYYAVFMPALFIAFDKDIRLPSVLVMNEFCLVEGAKASTSRRNAIWGRDLLAEIPADALRFYLAAIYPAEERTSFGMAELIDRVNKELVGQWQTWLEELAALMRRDFGNKIPTAGVWTEQHGALLHRLETLTMEAAQAYDVETFSPQRVVRTLCEIVLEARRFAKSAKGWNRGSRQAEEWQTMVALELLAAKLLALLSAPVLPGFAERLWRELGFETPLWNNGWEERPLWIPEGQQIHGLATSPYFPINVFR